MVSRSLRPVLVVSGIVAGALASGAPGAVAATSGSAARAAATPATTISRPVCTTSLDDPQQRAATFTVRASRGASATGFGFTAVLEERPAGGSWSPLTGAASPPGFGVFQPAAEGAAAMLRRINVRGLRPGSAYRLKASFRWTGPGGKQRVTRRSSACTVKELRPNVRLDRALAWTPGTSGDQVVYRAQLRVQRGAALAGRTMMLSVVQGTTVLGQVSAAPVPGRSVLLIPGTPCAPGTSVTYRVDVAPVIEESSAVDNEINVGCAAARAGSR